MTDNILYVNDISGASAEPIFIYDLVTDTQIGTHVIDGADLVLHLAVYDKLLLYTHFMDGLRAIKITDGQPVPLNIHGLECTEKFSVHVMDGK